MAHPKKQDSYTDQELIELLRKDKNTLSVLYRRHKENCMTHMRFFFRDLDKIKDIYQDVIIAFYEQVNRPGFSIDCSIQTYLNAICRNQVRKLRYHANRYKVTTIDDGEELPDNGNENEAFDPEQERVLKEILEEMKLSSPNCYEILSRFFYREQSMNTIARELGYTNADNAKNQKCRCQKKLKTELFKRMKK